jgi:2-hydroxy-6-oxonona-2,4-dienedioate hydrolase
MARIRKGRFASLFAGLVAAGFFGLIWARYRRDIRRERRRTLTGGRMARTSCGPIEYAEIGDGPPVLVVHGAGGGYDQGMDLGGPLAAKGFRVIAMSRFGYLRTPLPADASAAAQADAHAALLDALGIRRAPIVGASAGAPSSMQFALRHPDRCSALVLLVPAAYAPRPGGAPPLKTRAGAEFLSKTALKSDFLFWAAIRLARPFVTRAILGTPTEVVENADAAEQARVAEMLRHILPVSTRAPGLLNEVAVTSSLPRYDLERIAVPTLAISMEDDLYGTFDCARYTAEHVPGARFKSCPTGGHLLVGHHEEIIAEIAAFLVEAAACEWDQSATTL